MMPIMRCAISLVFLIGCGSVNAAIDAGGPAADADADADADAAIPGDAASTGLVAWYTMDSPAQQGTVGDASGHHHDGVCGGNSGAVCPLVGTGKVGGAYVFNGSTTFFRVRADAELNGTTGFTVAAWLNRGDAIDGCSVNKGFGSGEHNSWQTCTNAGGDVVFFSQGSVEAHEQDTSGHPLALSEWHHVALWWNGATKATYIDGQRTAQNDISIAFDSDDITIGADIDNGGIAVPFTGMLDDVRIYNRALSDAEIIALQSP